MSEATLRERVDGVHNVLLVERTPAASERVDSLFGSAGHGENVVIVSYERPVDEWLREREPDARPARLGYVRVSDESPASGADGATGGTWLVDAAVDPADPHGWACSWASTCPTGRSTRNRPSSGSTHSPDSSTT